MSKRDVGHVVILALTLAASGAAFAGTHADVVDLFASMTAALSDDNAAAFLKAVDKSSPDYLKLETYIPALLAEGDVASSVEFLKDEGDDQRRTVQLDWYLEIRSTIPAGPLVRRRKIIQCRLQKDKGKWRVVSVSPIAFFAPQKYS